eukprot:SAG31_NODE_2553_length_5503_cov_24.613064_4_plen_118_part_00
MWHVLVILTVRLGCSHGGDARTIVHPVAGEGGEQWNAVNLDCDPHAGPITIIRATYGVPCQPGCATCGNVALGNLDVDARSACDGKGCYFFVFVPTIREIRDFYREMQRTNRESIIL